MFQIRPRAGGPPYAPARDIANFFCPYLLSRAFHALEEVNWRPWFGDYLRLRGTREEDIGRAAVVMAHFASDASRTEAANVTDALQEAGYFDLPEPVQLAVMAVIGMLATGWFWAGTRDALERGTEPAGAPVLRDEAALVVKAFASPFTLRLRRYRALARTFLDTVKAVFVRERRQAPTPPTTGGQS